MLKKVWNDYQELRTENGEAFKRHVPAFKRHVPGTVVMLVILYIINYAYGYGMYKCGEKTGKWLGKHEGYAERMMDEYSRNDD